MLGLGGFGSRKPRQFSYKPLYWDEEKEEREARRKEREISDPSFVYKEEEYVPGSIIRAARARRMKNAQVTHKKSGVTLVRTLIFVVLIGLIIFLFADNIGAALDKLSE